MTFVHHYFSLGLRVLLHTFLIFGCSEAQAQQVMRIVVVVGTKFNFLKIKL